MYKILIFAGTMEGRKLAEFLDAAGVAANICVATEYGESLLPAGKNLKVSHERLNQEQMEQLMENLGNVLVVDATHPYAAKVTENIRGACEHTGKEYIRLLRESQEADLSDCICVDSVAEAVQFLSNTKGNIFVTTGSKELSQYCAIPDYQSRVYARVLSIPEVAAHCSELGFTGKHLICMQGPFSKELNVAMLKQFDADYLVTKDTGAPGGFQEKYEAAREAGAKLVVIGRPIAETGISLEECKNLLRKRLKLPKMPKNAQMIALVGIGMGDKGTFTVRGEQLCEQADLLIGARRMVESAGYEDKNCYFAYKPEEIRDYIIAHPEFKRVVILLSGDVGFYSGAKKLLSLLGEDVEVVPGIASPVYFCSKLKLSWEDAILVSMHGRETNLVGLSRRNRKVFTLAGSRDGIAKLCQRFVEYGMNDLKVHIGERLSYVDEKISHGNPKDFAAYETDGLSVLLIENSCPEQIVTPGIPDEAFLRDKVPMTKEEIREICLCKLRLTKDAVIYDVGAGTGSVSVEMALQAVDGKVYAVEKNPAAAALLKENKRKFAADNLEIIEGTAPDALEALPVPTHAFIGGSSGNLAEILNLLYQKNPGIRVVITAITMETTAEALKYFREHPCFEAPDIAQISAAKSRRLGSYHLMTGLNPVTIFASEGRGNQ